ncbi:cytochrome P450 6B6-like [Vanessa cardui]|uniref:cytochrome P450 6B6-like n=1 Tax=Vanessa cardui TaxID=171605 RepID=UPI001F13222F|nr:cytochrome P450 6B6-like [Vanessa cardui]
MFLILVVVFCIAFYFYGTRNFKYWEKRGVPYEKPLILVGSNLKQFIDGVSVSQRFSAFYRAFPNERFVGFFEGNNPSILVRDPELIKHMLITDFRYIHYRGLNPHRAAVEPLMKNLFTADGDVWKLMRKKLTPSFTTSKLKAMFPLIIERTKKLEKIADTFCETGKEVDMRELMAKYTTDFVGACGFGVDSAALDNENSDFRKLGKRLFSVTIRDHIVSLLKRSAPETFKDLHFFAPEIETKAFSILGQIMEQRNYKPSGRNDFMDMMLELRQQNKVIGESVEKYNPDGTPQIVELELDDKLLCAQIFVFFAAGFETSSSASSYLLHTLAYHPEIQERCQKEVDDVLKNYDGKLCFDAVHDMKYLAMALKESMRLLPSPGFLLRKTSSKYKIPESDVILDEDTMVVISTDGLCSDEKYFEDPEKFIPERFHPDNIHKIKPCTFMPFGEGPRACIGERMGLMQSMAGIATILNKFTVAPSPNSVRKPLIDPKSILVETIIGGLPLNLIRRQKAD